MNFPFQVIAAIENFIYMCMFVYCRCTLFCYVIESTNTENYPSKSALKASKALILPDDELPTQEPLHLDIDLSALNALPVPEDESEEEETDD